MSSSDDDFESGFLTPKKTLSKHDKSRGSKKSKSKSSGSQSLFNTPTKLMTLTPDLNEEEKCKVCQGLVAKLQLKSHYALKHPDHFQRMKDKLKEKKKLKQSEYFIGQNSSTGRSGKESTTRETSEVSATQEISEESTTQKKSEGRRDSSMSQEEEDSGNLSAHSNLLGRSGKESTTQKISEGRRDSSMSQEEEDSDNESIDPTLKQKCIAGLRKIAGVKEVDNPSQKPKPIKNRKKAERSCKCTNCAKAPCKECKQCKSRNKCMYKKCLNPCSVKVRCPKCTKEFKSKLTLKIHLRKTACQRIQHPKVRLYGDVYEYFFECPIEKKKFRLMKDASDHWERRHEDEGEKGVFAKKYHCKVCNHITMKSDTMLKHAARNHGDTKRKESEESN